ncbi:MAG: hypothetical protein RLZZ15_1098 [Verrucomicrobiota bacterium]|jgi:hypothetical protein
MRRAVGEELAAERERGGEETRGEVESVARAVSRMVWRVARGDGVVRRVEGRRFLLGDGWGGFRS